MKVQRQTQKVYTCHCLRHTPFLSVPSCCVPAELFPVAAGTSVLPIKALRHLRDVSTDPARLHDLSNLPMKESLSFELPKSQNMILFLGIRRTIAVPWKSRSCYLECRVLRFMAERLMPEWLLGFLAFP